MSGGTHIRAVGPESGGEAPGAIVGAADEPLTLDASWAEDAPGHAAWDEPHVGGVGRWALPLLSVLAVAGWTAFFIWAQAEEMLGGVSPKAAAQLVAQWGVPVLLVVALWQLVMRLSTREAGRFADAATALRSESEALEARLSVVNRELSLAREFLAAQGRELDTLGRMATQRISEHADRLQSLVLDNGSQVDAIASVSRAALDNMDKLRDDLPVIANAARDVSNQIGAAGNTAHGQLDELVAGFNRLNEFGQASERQVGSLRAKVDAAIAGFQAQATQLDEIAGARFSALRERSDAFRAELDGREVDALAAMRHRADRLREEMAASGQLLETQEEELLRSLQARITAIREGAETVTGSLGQAEDAATMAWNDRVDTLKRDLEAAIRHVEQIDITAKTGAQERLALIRQEATLVDGKLTESHTLFVREVEKRRSEAASVASKQAVQIAAQLAEIDAAIAERREQQEARSRALTRHGEAVTLQLDALAREMATAAEQGRHAEISLAAAIQALGERLTESRASLGDTDRAVAQLTDASVRLLELIRASAAHSETELPAAMSEAESRLTAMGERGEALALMLAGAGEKSREVSEYVIAASRDSANATSELRAMQAEMAAAHDENGNRISGLRAQLLTLAHEGRQVGIELQGPMREAIALLETSARAALDTLERGADDRIAGLAHRIAGETNEALDRALQNRIGSAIAQLEDTSVHAASAGRDVAIQLRDQLAKVSELAANLESRVARARERAEEQVDGDFARRVALITESLNSNAIDISRALSSDVTDTAWASYLRGDRGIFTRRAVRLLEPTEAREIAELYDANRDFREHVNRYIHDFEGMLRTMLSTRDGHAIGVTLLSSDMGKLYVTLAQAIERLRD
jgi:hypothetical protein